LSALTVFAPFQRLPDDFVLVRAGEMPQKSLSIFVINERSERTALRTPPGMQLYRKPTVINDALKRWRVPHFSNGRTLHHGYELIPKSHSLSRIRALFLSGAPVALPVHAKRSELSPCAPFKKSQFDVESSKNSWNSAIAIRRRLK
jgi:hypothetical protein